MSSTHRRHTHSNVCTRNCLSAHMAMTTGPRLGLDIGDCLSSRRNVDDCAVEGLYRATAPGAWAFLCLYEKQFGLGDVIVVTRTNRGEWYTLPRQ